MNEQPRAGFPVTTHIQFGDGISVTDLGNQAIRVDAASTGGGASPIAIGRYNSQNAAAALNTGTLYQTEFYGWTLTENTGKFAVDTISSQKYVAATDPLGTFYDIGVVFNFDTFIADTQPSYAALITVDNSGNPITFGDVIADVVGNDISNIAGTQYVAYNARFIVRSSSAVSGAATHLRFTLRLFTWANPVTVDAYLSILRR